MGRPIILHSSHDALLTLTDSLSKTGIGLPWRPKVTCQPSPQTTSLVPGDSSTTLPSSSMRNIRNVTVGWGGGARLMRRSLGYECNHQRNLKTMRSVKSNALSLRRATWNRICLCDALMICATLGLYPSVIISRADFFRCVSLGLRP
jgi:hypothetical protein